MRVYKIELMVIDFDDVAADDVKSIIENSHYPNRCISPKVVDIQATDCGEWSDDHKLNSRNTWLEEYDRLFSMEA